MLVPTNVNDHIITMCLLSQNSELYKQGYRCNRLMWQIHLKETLQSQVLFPADGVTSHQLLLIDMSSCAELKGKENVLILKV